MMGDRPGSPSRVRTSEDKVHRKDLCGSVRAVYVLEKLPDVSGPGLVEAGRYRRSRGTRWYPPLRRRSRRRRARAHRSSAALSPLSPCRQHVGPGCQRRRGQDLSAGHAVNRAGPVTGLGFRFIFFYYFS
jgi:hypothetical protein